MILQRLAKYDFHEMTFARWFMQKTDNRALSLKYCRTLSYNYIINEEGEKVKFDSPIGFELPKNGFDVKREKKIKPTIIKFWKNIV